MKRNIIIIVLVLCNIISFAQDISKIERQAKQGDAAAQALLAFYYYQGKDVEKDINKAIYWYNQAIEGGYEEAKVNLALVYHNQKEYEKSFPLFLSFVDNSQIKGRKDELYNTALANIGHYKMIGRATPIDINGAIKYLEQAHSNGYNVYMDLSECYDKTGEFQKKFMIDKEGFEKSAIPFNLAKDYLFGIGCKQDLNRVYELLSGIASGNLVYHMPDGGRVTFGEPYIYAAKCYIGIAYYFDKTKKNHYEDAVKLFNEVIVSTESSPLIKGNAMCVLQRCYRFGRGTKKDLEKANEYEREAKLLLTEEGYNNFSKHFQASY